ncbi:MAG: S-layer homology domain-containing protein [Clostridia bacterium]|nr:S-layer homology domain-containing protein [Clostridia bacterium]
MLLQSPDFELNSDSWTRAHLLFQNTAVNYGTQGYRPVIGVRQSGTADGDNFAVYIDDVSLTVVQAARLDKPTGSEEIAIPSSGSVTESYTTTVYNEFDETKVSQSRVTWSLQEAKEGVSIDAQSGVLTVSSTATAGTVNIIASQDGVSSQALSVALGTIPEGEVKTLSFSVTGGGSVKVKGKTIGANTADKTVAVAVGEQVVLQLVPDVGSRVQSVLFGTEDITGQISDNSVTTPSVTEDQTITVAFAVDLQNNLFENGEFEAGSTNPWIAYPVSSASTTVLTVDDSVARSGSKSLKADVTTTTAAWNLLGAVYQMPTSGLDLTKVYQATAWVKTDSADRHMLAAVWYRANGSAKKQFTIAKVLTTPADGWKKITVTINPSQDLTADVLSTIDRIDIAFGCDKSDATGTLWIDDASLSFKMAEAVDVAITEQDGVLIGNYRFADYTGQIEKDSAYRWLRATSPNAGTEDWEAVASGTCTASQPPRYTLGEEDFNHYFRFEITPKAEGYTGETIQSGIYTGPFVPVASDVSIEGNGVVGRELTGQYTYADQNDDEQEGTTYRWLSCATENGTYQPISGATEQTFTVPTSLSNSYIKFEVTPKNAALGGDKGIPVLSDALFISSDNTPPAAQNVSITGAVSVSSLVAGTYQFIDANGDAEGASRYQWYIADSQEGPFTPINGETAKTFSIPSVYAGKYLQFEVTPVDAFDLTGTAVRSDPVLVQQKQEENLYVAVDGDDSNPGTKDQPLATLEGARDTLRRWKEEGKYPVGGATVYLRGGTYHLSSTFTLTEQDSGTQGAPVVYRPYGDEKVVISGGAETTLSQFSPVSGEMKEKLKAGAKDKVVVADLADLNLGEIAELRTNSSAQRYNLFGPLFEMDGKKMMVARYPNSDFRTEWIDVSPSATSTTFDIAYTDSAISSWTHNIDDIWYLGYWRFEWAAEFIQGTIQSGKITGVTPTNYGAAKGTRKMRAYNVYEEMDEPGEWYYDQETGKLYLYPVEGTTGNSVIRKTGSAVDLISLDHASYVTIYGLDITGGGTLGVRIKGGEGNRIDSCDIHLFEQTAVSIEGDDNRDNGIQNSRIYSCGAGGVTVNGGDKTNIIPAGNFIKNNEIFDFSMMKDVYSAGISLRGVGNVASYNELYNSPHLALSFNGVENVMEHNKFHNVCRNAADMGVIYSGRNLSDQGNIIRYNYFYDVGNPNQSTYYPCCVFADDGSSNMEVYGNVAGPGVEHSQIFKLHGGMNHKIYQNLLIDAPVGFYQNCWKNNVWYERVVGSGMTALRDSFNTIKDNPLYWEKWPYIKDLRDSSGSASTIVYVDKYPNTVKENVILYVNESPASNLYNFNRPVVGQETNLQLKGNPNLYKTYVKDWEGGNYTLTDQAYQEIRKSIPEFQTIPFEAIGRTNVVNQLPVAESVKIYRSAENILTGSYLYKDAERDPEGETVVRWLVADTDEYSAYTEIPGADQMSFTYTDEYGGKYIRLEVTPKDSIGRAGTTVRSQAIHIVTNREGFLDQIEEAQKKADSATAGNGLGQYPENAVEALQAAIEEARAAYESPSTETPEGLAAAVEKLAQAVEEFGETRIVSVTDSRKEGTIEVPSDLENMELILPEITGIITLSGSVLPKGRIEAVISGKKITVEIPQPIALKTDKFTIAALDDAGIDGLQNIGLCCQIGEPGESYTPALNVAVEGITESRVGLIKAGKLEDIPDMIVSGQEIRFALSEGYQIAAYDSIVLSSDSSLKKLAVNGTEISLSQDKLEYSITLPEGTKEAVITAEPNHEGAKVSIPEITKLPARKVEITVTAQDGTKTVYLLTVTVKISPTTSPSEKPQPIPSPNPIGGGGGSIGGIGTSSLNRPVQTPEVSTEFQDIAGHWAEEDIKTMYQKGIVVGVTSTSFEPDREVTRAEFAVMIVKSLKISSKNSAGFTDVKPGDWYEAYVNAAANAGLIVGYGGQFRPDDLITREEMAVIMAKAYRYLEKPEMKGGIEKFSDKGEISDWAYSYVDEVTSAGLIQGTTADTFAGKENTTRAQAASVLLRLIR